LSAVGFVTISVFGFLLRSPPPLGAGIDPMYLYYAVILGIGNGILWWFAYIPPDAQSLSTSSNTNNLRTFREGIKAMGEWLPLIKWNCLALMIDMYAVSFFTAIPFYVYNDDYCSKAMVAAGSKTCSTISVRPSRPVVVSSFLTAPLRARARALYGCVYVSVY
jgi:hypothetical protein